MLRAMEKLREHSSEISPSFETRFNAQATSARTIGAMRTVFATMAKSALTQDETEVLANAKTSFDGVTQGHDHVRLEDLEAGKLGYNERAGTQNTAVTREFVTLDALSGSPAELEETLDHEDDRQT